MGGQLLINSYGHRGQNELCRGNHMDSESEWRVNGSFSLAEEKKKSTVNLKNSKRLREEKRCRGHRLSIHFLEAEWVMHQLAGLKEGKPLCWGIHGNSDKPCAKERSDDTCYCSVKLIRPMDKTHYTCAMHQHWKSCSLQPSGGNTTL